MNEQQHAEDHWIGSWFASQTYGDQTIAEERFENQTLRMIVHPHAFGSKLRLKFSNLYGSEPVHFGKVTAALSEENGLIVPGTCRHVTLHGHATITIPAGEELYTDSVDLQIHENVDVVISVYIPASTRTSTWHFSPPSSSFVAEGNRTDDSGIGHFRKKIHSYYWLSGLEVLTYGDPYRVIVALGDSITEGSTSTQGTNRRWPDFLQERLDREQIAHPISVLNAGIVGNQILTNGPDAGMPLGGESILSRLERDVFTHSGVTDVIFLAGINDIGIGNASANEIIAGMKETAARVHEKGLRIFAGTLPPFGKAPYYTREKEIIRQEVNRWILANEGFDGIIDFNGGLADPQHPEQLLPAYDFGDHLHPNDKGFKALADCIPLSLFRMHPNQI